MCGIAGFLTLRGDPLPPDDAEATLLAMRDELIHRGPDEGAAWWENGVGLSARRLSIIDVSGSHQPQAGPSGKTQVVFNGEIYNYRDLRGELLKRGHTLRTQGDTETLPHLYEAFGIQGLLERLVGMFAFALYDQRSGSLLLARDRLGIKPLYYAEMGGHLLFGSELKALLAHPACLREMDRESLRKYLLFEYVPSPHSIYRGIRKLPPGHYLWVKDGKVEVHRYWRPTFRKDGEAWEGDPLPASDDEVGWSKAVFRGLDEAVNCRLVSEVPIGCLLSGGLDSSSITALMARKVPELRTFSIAFDEPGYDESVYSREVSQLLGTRHTEGRVRSQDVPSLLQTVAGFLDEPLGDGSLLPTYVLSKLVRDSGVTVVLSGDGADELFAGYPTYLAHRAAAWVGKMPRPLLGAASFLAHRLPTHYGNVTREYKLRRFLAGVREPLAIRNNLWLGAFLPDEASALLGEEAGTDPFAEALAHVEDCDAEDPVERAQYLDMRMYMGDDILVKVDRASMAASVEARVPYLDHRLVELVCRMPSRYKLRGRTGKYLLRRILKGIVPDSVLQRPKKGFGLPAGPWLRGPLREVAGDMLSSSRLNRVGGLDARVVEGVWKDHQEGRADRRRHLFSLLIFLLWWEGRFGPSGKSAVR